MSERTACLTLTKAKRLNLSTGRAPTLDCGSAETDSNESVLPGEVVESVAAAASLLRQRSGIPSGSDIPCRLPTARLRLVSILSTPQPLAKNLACVRRLRLPSISAGVRFAPLVLRKRTTDDDGPQDRRRPAFLFQGNRFKESMTDVHSGDDDDST